MPNWKKILTTPIAKNAEFFVFMYALGMVAAVCTVNFQWKQRLYEHSWWELALWLYAIAALLAVLPKIVRRITRGIIYIVAYTVAIVDVYCFVKFESALNPSILMLVNETDPREAGEFFSSYVTPDLLLTNVGWVLLVLLVHLIWTVHRNTKRPAALYMIENRISAWMGRRALLWSCVIAALMATSICFSHKNLKELYVLMNKKTLGEVEHKLTEKDRGNQFLPMYRLAFSIRANNLAAQQIDILHDVAGKVTVDSCSFTSPEIVLIIGEAYNKRHSQLYGYEYETTPRQLQLEKEGSLVKFDDVVAPWNLTSYVFKHFMSTYTVGDSGAWCDYPLFTQVFRRAGYHVSFLTNEFLPKAKQAVYDFSGGFFLNDPVLSNLQFDSRNKKLHIFDEGLLHDYRQMSEERRQKGDTLQRGNLTIFHLIGQHQDYRIRCPKSKRHFTVDDYADRTDLKPRWKRNLCNYDNATRYNDSIVTEMIRLFENKDAIVIYMPDHGEEVHSRQLPHFSGRMHSTKIIKRLAREEFEIPFWIWASDKYRTNHLDVWQETRQASSRRYMTDALPHLLMYLGGIHCQYYNPELNILSPKYNEQRPRILKNQTDYDVLMAQ